MQGRLPITVVASLAAFALGYQIMKPQKEMPVADSEPVSPKSEITLAQHTTTAEASPPLKIPLDLLSEVEFSQFEEASLEVTKEARYILGMTDAEAAAVSKAAQDLRASMEAYEEKQWESRPDLPFSSAGSGVAAEIPPMGSVADTLEIAFYNQVGDILGTERTAFLEVPVRLYKEETKMLQYIPSHKRYQLAFLRWDGQNIFTQHASMTKHVPPFLETFFAMQEEAE